MKNAIQLGDKSWLFGILTIQAVVFIALVIADHFYNFSLSLALLWLFAVIAYNIFSFGWGEDDTGEPRSIDADEVGVQKFYGSPLAVLDSGLPYAPPGVLTIEKLPITVQQDEYPGEPQDIYRGDGPVPEDKVPPVRVTFRSSVTEDQARHLLGSEFEVQDMHGNTLSFQAEAPEDGLAKRVTAEVVPIVRWKINKDTAIQFIRSIGSIKEARRQIEDEMFTVLQRILPNMSVGQAKQNLRWINALLIKAVRERTHEWGVHIEGAALKMIPLNHDLNDAIALAAEAEFRGRGERELIEQTGAGKAKASYDNEEQTLKGRTAGLVALARDLGIEGDVAIAQFVAGEIAKGQGTIIFGESGLGQLAGIGGALLNQQKASSSSKDGGNTQ